MNDLVFFAFTMCCCVLCGWMLGEDRNRGSFLAPSVLLAAMAGVVLLGAMLAWRLITEWLA